MKSNTTSLALGRNHLLCGLLTLSMTASPAWCGDWVVDDNGGPGVDYQDIQNAIQNAAPGDTIFIRNGSYTGFVIDGKALTLTRDDPSPGWVYVPGSSTVRNISVGSGVELDGITLDHGTPSLRLENNTGAVWISDCNISGRPGEDGFPAGPALISYASSDVGFIRCTLTGGAGEDSCGFGITCPSSGGDAADAVRAELSDLQFFECNVLGGSGGSGDSIDDGGGYAGHGVRASISSTIYGAWSDFEGGAPGWPDNYCGTSLVLDASSVARQFESTFVVPSCPQAPVDPPHADSTAFCFGTPSNCACSNGGLGGGCQNSYAASAGRVYLTGNASVSADTITLRHEGLPAGKTLLFFQGTQQAGGAQGIPLGDGLRCTGGNIIRLATRVSSGGVDSVGFGVGSDPSISALGAVPAGGATRYYQVWYRDPNAACGTGNFNLSNGLVVNWKP